jgi:hypothetical protein
MSLQKECIHCKKSYSSIYYLRIHEVKCKSQQIIENSENKCEFCNKNFYSIYNLKTHIEKCKSKIIKTQENFYLNNQKYLEEKVKSLETENLHLKNIISQYEIKAKEYEIEKKYMEEFKENFKENYKEMLNRVNTTINYTSNITLKQVVSKLEPISYEDIKNSMSLFSNEYIDDGIVGFARFLCEHSCNNKIVTSDKSRNTIAYRTKFNDFIKDPECIILINNTLRDNSEEIIKKAEERRDYYRDLMDIDDEFDTYLKRGTKIQELKKLTESSMSEKSDDNIKKISNILCNHGVKTYQKTIEQIKL